MFSLAASKVMMVAGYTNEAINDVEVLDLRSESTTCLKPRQMITKLTDATGTYMDEQVLVCGGSTDTEAATTDCFTYNAMLNSWSKSLTIKLNQERSAFPLCIIIAP